MRTLKFTALVVVLLVVGLFVHVRYLEPRRWRGENRDESIRLLSMAKTSGDLQAAVGMWGVFIAPTNGGWLAIRYRDTHAPSWHSLSIAVDSDGRWFECGLHFCGKLRHVSHNFANEIRMRQEIPEFFTNRTERAPTTEDLISLFTATNLDAARRQLVAIGFREFKPTAPSKPRK